ncbi:alpha/beta hydrolase-fold protein [Gaetbulibacter aestuarii]|uniref:Alpha/beta hydrolase-fold protein n=1 Tax=Gaetbulibacter aestuarii TaxID=1502358 RepID=A0ABW7MX89_9FLAO
MKKAILIISFFLLGIIQAISQNNEQITIGTKHTLHSKILNENRPFLVSLPEGYNDKNSSYKRYPVLIVLDGNIHFQSISGMVNYMSSGYNGNLKIPEMIIVAIENINRRRDFTPDKIITTRKNDSGGGERFLSFLENELIPFLDENYRTEPYRILFGHSLGGLLAAHTYMKEHTLFNAFLAVDPSFGAWDATTMDNKLATVTDNSFERFIYIATANWGKRNFRNRDRHVRFYEALNSKCKNEFPGKLEYFENENHGSVPPLAFYHGISALFDGYGVYYRDVKNTKQLEQHFQTLSDRLSWNVNPPEALVNRIGYTMLRSNDQNKKSEALAFFIMNTKNYPKSFNAFDSLAEAYDHLGNIENAIKNYEKSLAHNPNNENAKTKIKILREDLKNSKQTKSYLPNQNPIKTIKMSNSKPLIKPGLWQSMGKNPFWINVVENNVFWLGMNQKTDDVNLGENWCHVGLGKIKDDTLELTWADIPAGKDQLNGKITVEIINETHMKVIQDSGNFGKSEWHWVALNKSFSEVNL